jgi:transcriptional regulator with XRE-family HTH domain
MDIDRRILLAARALAGLTQSGLADRVGLHLNALQRIEAGGSMRQSTLEKLIRALSEAGVELTRDPFGNFEGLRFGQSLPRSASAGPFRIPRKRQPLSGDTPAVQTVSDIDRDKPHGQVESALLAVNPRKPRNSR